MPRRIAVLVGVNAYADPTVRPLQYAAPDAAALDELLGRLGYETHLLHDGAPRPELLPTRRNVEAAIARAAAGAGEDALLLVYFACHGTRQGGQALLVLRDAARARLRETALPVAAVERRLRRSAAGQKVLVLDACHAGIDLGRDLDRVTDAEFLEQVHAQAQGFALLAASTAGQKALEEASAGHGLFTSYLIDGLAGAADRSGRGFVTVSDLWTYVGAQVRAYSARNDVLVQEPTSRVEGFGDMALSDGPAEPPRWPRPAGLPRDAYPPRRFSDWEPLGGLPRERGAERAPRHLCAALGDDGRVHLFAVRFRKGGAGTLWHRVDDGQGLSGWAPLGPDGGALTNLSGGVAVAPGEDANALELVLCEAGHLVHRTLRGDALSGEAADLGPAERPDLTPTMFSRAPGWLDLFVCGQDNCLWQKWRMPGHPFTEWQSPIVIEGVTGDPAGYSWDANKGALYTPSTGGGLLQITCLSFAMYYWDRYDLGGEGLRAPLPLSRGANHLDLFARDGRGRLWQRTWYQGLDWSEWVMHEGPALVAGPAGVCRGPGSIGLCGFAADGQLYGKRWRG